MPYNVRGLRGKLKGKFVKKKVRAKIEAVAAMGKALPKVEYKNMEGRRIVELDKLSEDLWCAICNIPLSLRSVIREAREGLATTMEIKCHQCSRIHRVDTCSKSNKDRSSDVNLKLAIGMYDAGIGERATNTFLSALNIPTVGSSSMKRYERQVGPAILNVANRTCQESIETEKRLTQENNMNLT